MPPNDSSHFTSPRDASGSLVGLAPFIAVYIVLATISGYRAIVQIYRVDLKVADTLLQPGSTIAFSYVSSARVPTDAEVELIQGTTKRSLAAFAPGTARLRITAYGNMQWLRTPPPVVKEIPVTIAALSAPQN